MKSRRKINIEDNENTPLLTRDKFKDILSKKIKANKALIIILLILIIITLFIIIGKTIQSLIAINDNLKVLDVTINFEVLKVDIYLEAILSLHYCLIEKKDEIKKKQIPEIQKTKLTDLMNQLNRIQEHVNIILNNKKSLGIFKVIENNFYIITLENDWRSNKRKSDLLYETRRLSYIISNAINDDKEICNMDLLYEFSITDIMYTMNNDLSPPTQKQKLFFYFVANILNTYKKSFENLSKECVSSLLKMWNVYEKIQMYFIHCAMFTLFIFFIIFCVKYCLDTSFYQLLFLYYYNIEKKQKKFESQIYYLYKTTLEFNYDNIKYFEYIKANYNDINDINNKANNNNLYSNLNKDKIDVLEQNSMNGSLLNSSMNGSSIQFLNRTNKFNLNNKIENNNNTQYEGKKEENPENINSQEETIDTLLKFTTNILPYSHRYSLIFILFNFIIYLGLFFLCIYEIIYQIYKYDFSINLSMNILERVPRIMELVLYSTITVILNQTTIIPNNNHQSITLFTIFNN